MIYDIKKNAGDFRIYISSIVYIIKFVLEYDHAPFRSPKSNEFRAYFKCRTVHFLITAIRIDSQMIWFPSDHYLR